MRFVQFYRWAVDELYKMHANERDIELYLLRYLFNGGASKIQSLYDTFKNLEVPTSETSIVFAIDEAVNFNVFQNEVPRDPALQGATNGNFLTLLVSACRKMGPVVCFSTKFSESEIRSLVSGAADFRGSTLLINGILPTFYMQDVKTFLSKFIQISDVDMKLVGFFLQGRPRLCELFINSVISYGEDACDQSSTTFIQGFVSFFVLLFSIVH